MAETFDEYRNRILGYLGDRDPISVQRATPARLRRLIRGVPRHVLLRRPAPGRWSVVEIVAHLADAELAMGWRLRNMLATPGVGLQWWDEHLWSEKCNYAGSLVKRWLHPTEQRRDGHIAGLITMLL